MGKRYSVEIRVFDEATHNFELYDCVVHLESLSKAKAFIRRTYDALRTPWKKVVSEEERRWENFSVGRVGHWTDNDKTFVIVERTSR